MLKEDSRYDYAEVQHSAPSPSAAFSTTLRPRKKTKHLTLPARAGLLAVHSMVPLQSYLRERFSHLGGKNNHSRELRAENQRLHDIAATLGHWPMSRTS